MGATTLERHHGRASGGTDADGLDGSDGSDGLDGLDGSDGLDMRSPSATARASLQRERRERRQHSARRGGAAADRTEAFWRGSTEPNPTRVHNDLHVTAKVAADDQALSRMSWHDEAEARLDALGLAAERLTRPVPPDRIERRWEDHLVDRILGRSVGRDHGQPERMRRVA